MKELYNHYELRIYPHSPITGYPEKSDVLHQFSDNVVAVNPGRRNTELRTMEYRDFRLTETCRTRAGAVGTLTYIPTGEVIADNVCVGQITPFVCWYYFHRS